MCSQSPIRWAVDISQWQPDQLEWQSLLDSLPAEVASEVFKYRSSRLKAVADLHKAFFKQLTKQEWVAVESAGDIGAQMRMFQTFWSLKEAFVKARGDGLGFDLGNAEFCIHTMQAGMQAATVSVGGQLLDRWKFYVHSLGQGHVVSVALGPPEDVVDAWGEFKSTLQKPHIGTVEMQAALSAPEPPFTVMDMVDLL